MPVRCLTALVLAIGVGFAPGATAQSWPTQPVRVIVGFPGGMADAILRYLQEKLEDSLGQPIVVGNRPGARAMQPEVRPRVRQHVDGRDAGVPDERARSDRGHREAREHQDGPGGHR